MIESSFRGSQLRAYAINEAITSSMRASNISPVELFIQYLAPMTTVMIQFHMLCMIIWSIRVKSVGSRPSFPYSALMINSIAGVMFGIMNADDGILYSAVIGLIISIVCLTSCYWYGSCTRRLSREAIIIAVSTALATWMFLGHRKHLLAIYYSTASLLLVASPLVILQNAFENVDKNSKIPGIIDAPYNMTFLMWFYSLIWMTHGVIVKTNPLLYGPNILGLMISTLELLLCGILSNVYLKH